MHTANKRKLLITAGSLVLCFCLLISSSYAWLTISRAPEITGISTSVGANGSLEIALLNESTYTDPSLIRTGVGDSQMVQDIVKSNLTWGNVIDLSDDSYGLSQIQLRPSVLQVTNDGEGGIVSSSFLNTVEYGWDGRVGLLNSEMAAAVYGEKGFFFDSEKPGYGVRGIGVVSRLSPQQSALTVARSMVAAYTASASDIAEAAWRTNGSGLVDIYMNRYLWNSSTFDQTDIAVIRNMAEQTLKAYSYFDGALRQGIIGYAAAELTDVESFRLVQENVGNTSIPLSMLVAQMPNSLPSELTGRVDQLEAGQTELMGVIRACDKLKDDSIPWEQISVLANVLLEANEAYLGEYRMNRSEAYAQIEKSTVLTMPPGSGRLAEIADYCGNYRVLFDFSNISAVEATTTSRISKPHLQQISKMLDECEIADTGEDVTVEELGELYGFAMDMAFRCNTDTQLLLQTQAAARVDSAQDILGDGSSLTLHSEQLAEDRVFRVMDALRIGFLDNQNHLLAVAKASTSQYTSDEDGITAPLYLYEYEISPGGNLLMGERRSDDTAIADLASGAPMTVTVIVWLDGAYVDNSMAAIFGQSVEGTMNLQFASSADLKPAQQTITPTE